MSGVGPAFSAAIAARVELFVRSVVIPCEQDKRRASTEAEERIKVVPEVAELAWWQAV